MTKDEVRSAFLGALPIGWNVPTPKNDAGEDLRSPIDVWLELLSEEELEKAEEDRIKRLVGATATLAVALSRQKSLAVDPAALYLAAIIMAAGSNKLGIRRYGRVCSGVSLWADAFDLVTRKQVADLYNAHFVASGLPLFE